MKKNIKTFLGKHPFRPECLGTATLASIGPMALAENSLLDQMMKVSADRYDVLSELIAQGKCPRCRDKLPSTFIPNSSAIPCRCIPLCPSCFEQEPFDDAAFLAWPLSEGALRYEPDRGRRG